MTSEVSIPQKVHSRLLGGGRRLIHDIQDQCGGVHIKFPPEKSSSDKVLAFAYSVSIGFLLAQYASMAIT